jgi:hypothetical protein
MMYLHKDLLWHESEEMRDSSSPSQTPQVYFIPYGRQNSLLLLLILLTLFFALFTL